MSNSIHRLEIISWQITVLTLVAGVGTLVLFWKNLPPEVPLWYGRPWGQDMLSGKWGLWYLPGIVGSLQIVGLVLSRWLRSDSLLAGLVLATIIVAQIVCTLALLRIITIII